MSTPNTDRIYFTVAAKSPAANVFRSWQESVTKHRGWVKTFADDNDMGKCCWIGHGPLVVGFGPPDGTGLEQREWWTKLDPKWRRVRVSRGSDYAVPRKTGEGKPLAKAWASRPVPQSSDYIKAELTGLVQWSDWMTGMLLCSIGWMIKPNGSAIVTLPYFVTKNKKFKPLAGMTVGKDQMKLREEMSS